LILRMYAQRNRRGLAVGDDRPGELRVAEILRHRNREDAPLAPRQKMRRLTVVGPARLDAIVRPDGNVDHLFQVAIEVADEEVDAAVGLVEPAFEGAGHRFARVAIRTEGQRRRLRLRGESDSRRDGQDDTDTKHTKPRKTRKKPA